MTAADAPRPPTGALLTLDAAVALLRAGRVVGIPTETVYGLAADALNAAAVADIFAFKGRPADHPLIVHLPSLDALAGWVTPGLPDDAALLGARFWPGPLTLILPRGPLASDAVTAGLDTVGVRVPDHPVALELLRRLGTGLAAPSANRFGHVSPTTAAHVLADLGDRVAGVLDGGPSRVGVESTIVDLSRGPAVVLRHGGIALADLAAVLGYEPVDGTREAPTVIRSPGQVSSHYAPRAQLEVVPEAELATRAQALRKTGVRVHTLGRAELGQDADAWARSLYAALRDADSHGPDVILVVEAPPGRLVDAVRDRLKRAAAPTSGRH